MPSKFIGLLLGGGESSSLLFCRSNLELIVRPVGLVFDCRGIAEVCKVVLRTGPPKIYRQWQAGYHLGQSDKGGVKRA